MYCWLRLTGTGKSTLINFIISALDLDSDEDVAYVTYTGKASEVLREKGCTNAVTAHKLLYFSRQKPDGKFTYIPRYNLEHQYKMIVVDEISMLPHNMWELLLKHKVHILACGDPFQIPPIDKDQDNHVLDSPHIFLDEVMRQAKESDIICLSMDIREGKKIHPLKGNDVQIFNKNELISGMYSWADQIICSTNNTRSSINNDMRKIHGYSKEPEIGDKVICCRNSWDILSIENSNPLINGTIGTLVEFRELNKKLWSQNKTFNVPILLATIATENDKYLEVEIDKNSLTTGKKTLTPQDEYSIKKKFNRVSLPIEFNYGYAITGHRAQGSQWNKVLVIEEGFPYDKTEHAKWLYTAVTRPSEKLTLILKD